MGAHMIDTHCHLNFHAFEGNHAEVVARAKAAGVTAIVAPSTYLGSSEQAIALSKEYPGWLFPAVGHHPTHVIDRPFNIDTYRRLATTKLANGERSVVAIGEIGLDAHRDEARATLGAQQAMLRQLLDLAVELGKPVILHCRNAYDELLTMLRTMPERPNGVLHCFAPVAKAGYEGSSSPMEIANAFLELGYAIGFTGIVTYPANEALRSVTAQLPLEQIVVETDAPFLAPQRYRGQPNEPAYVVEVAAEIARVRGVSVEAIDHATTANARRIFRLI